MVVQWMIVYYQYQKRLQKAIAKSIIKGRTTKESKREIDE
jgi:hypothetical protein